MIKNKIYSNKKNENEIYISSKKRNFTKMYFDRAYELLINKNNREIFIYGLGVCVTPAVNLSLIILEGITNIKINKIETQTVNTFDEFVNEENKNVSEN